MSKKKASKLETSLSEKPKESKKQSKKILRTHSSTVILKYPNFITPPSNMVHELDDIVIKSDLDTLRLTEDIPQRFNAPIKKNKSCFVEDVVRGSQILPGTFLLGVRNNVPELHGPSTTPIASRITPKIGSFTKIIDTYNQTDLFFGINGSYVLNVPKGNYAKAMSGQTPVMYDEGTHVIHDANLSFEISSGYVSSSENHIEHRTINIVRVGAGLLAKIVLDGNPYILGSRKNVYVFKSPNFKFVEFTSESENYIHHGTIHILRVPSGKLAKISIGSEPHVLEPRDEPYIYNTPLFKLKKANNGLFFDASENYIQHETIHILRVPSGKLAKISVGSDAFLLEPRDEPYVYNTPLFILTKPDDGGLFFDATQQITSHGAIKRVIPHTGQVVVTYENGQLKIIEPAKDGKPIIITSPTHEVTNLMNIGVETLVFPSEKSKIQRRNENPKATLDEIAFYIFTTSDSLKIGVKLLVAFEVENPQLALSKLISYEGIIDHIENCAIVDMGKAIQRCTATEFTSSYYNQPQTIEDKEKAARADPIFTSHPILHFQDEIKRDLGKDLSEFGIKLIRLNIETPKIIDKDIQKAMEEQSIISAKVNTEAANLERKYKNAKRQAEQEAETKRIKVQQENDAKKSCAEADLAAARSRADAEIIKAEAEARAKLIKEEAAANARLLAAKAEREAQKMLGDVYKEHPELVQLKIEEFRTQAISNFKGSLVAPGVNPMVGGLYSSSPLSFYNAANMQAPFVQTPPVEQKVSPFVNK